MGQDYEVDGGVGCHIFIDYESYDALLAAISRWWASIAEESKTILSIEFNRDGGGCNADLHWSWLTPGKKRELDEVLGELPKLKVPEPPEN